MRVKNIKNSRIILFVLSFLLTFVFNSQQIWALEETNDNTPVIEQRDKNSGERSDGFEDPPLGARSTIHSENEQADYKETQHQPIDVVSPMKEDDTTKDLDDELSSTVDSKNTMESTSSERSEDITFDLNPEEQPKVFKAIEETKVEVKDFQSLKQAIEDSVGATKIIVTDSFEMLESIIIGRDKEITLVSQMMNLAPVGTEEDSHIALPKEDTSKAEREKLVEEVRAKGEIALDATNLETHSLPSEDERIILRRSNQFKGTFFNTWGVLKLGEQAEDSITLDGNGEKIETSNKAIFINVNQGGYFEMNGGIITNANNKQAYSAPIVLRDGARSVLNGGRITKNLNKSYYMKDGSPYATGGIYVSEEAQLTINGGSIDNNTAAVGGVFVGSLYNDVNKSPGKVIMNGGIIAHNRIIPNANYFDAYGGGVHVDANGTFQFNDGVIAGNESFIGGGIAVTDNYVSDYNGVNFSKTNAQPYEDYVKHHKAELQMNGGLIYKNVAKVLRLFPNHSGTGGGINLNSSTAHLNNGYLLDNTSENMGGGIYVTIVPHTLNLTHTLISQNKAISGNYYGHAAGNGGGYWNCPVGIVDFEDFHSLYVFDNESKSGGKDIHTIRKAGYYTLNGKRVDDTFYTSISPITEKGNLIKYIVNGREVPETLRTNGAITLETIYNDQAKKEAWENSNFFIIGNTALKGGGVGSNAHIYAPGQTKDVEIIIEKKWANDINREEYQDKNIQIDLFIGKAGLNINHLPSYDHSELYKYREVILNQENGWSQKVKNLPYTVEELKAKELQYYVKEVGNDYYSVIEAHEQTVYNKLNVIRRYIDNDYDETPDPSAHYYLGVKGFNEDGVEINNRYSYALKRDPLTGEMMASVPFEHFNLKVTDQDKINISYYGYDTPPFDIEGWENFRGLEDNTYANPIKIYNKASGFDIKLPFLWFQYMTTGSKYHDPNVNYDDNTVGYRVELADQSSHYIFTITNHRYEEIPVQKRWGKTVTKEERPKEIKVYLLRNNERVKDSNGNERFVVLDSSNNWQGTFEQLPSFNIESMGFDTYSIEEADYDDIFEQTVTKETSQFLDITVERISFDDYKINEDYTGGSSRIKSIPIELHLNDQVIRTDQIKKIAHSFIDFDLLGYFKDVKIDGELEPTVHFYYDEHNEPFQRNLGKYQAFGNPGVSNELKDVNNEGSYIFKLKKDEASGKYVLYAPKLTSHETDKNLLDIKINNVGLKQHFVLTNEMKETEIHVNKKWLASNGETIKAPVESIDVILFADDEETNQQVTLNETNHWQATFERLPLYKKNIAEDGIATYQEIKYRVEEKSVKNGEIEWNYRTFKVEIDMTKNVLEYLDVNGMNQNVSYNVVISNIYQIPKTDITVDKVWVGGKERPSIEVQLYRDGEAYSDVVTLVNNMYTWTELDQTDASGNEYVYSVKEVNVPTGYTSHVDGFTITNTYEIPKTEITVNKVWVGGPADRPTIEIQLYRNGEAYGQVVQLKEGETRYTWDNLDLTDLDGNVYIYTVDEINVPEYYKKEVKGMNIINTFIPPPETPGPKPDPEPDPERTPSTLPQTGEANLLYLGWFLLVIGLMLNTFEKQDE